MKIANPTYNFFYQFEEDGVIKERPFWSGRYFDAKETLAYQELDLALRNGFIKSFGWTTILPYSIFDNQ